MIAKRAQAKKDRDFAMAGSDLWDELQQKELYWGVIQKETKWSRA